jgi:hypothetical protein
MLKGNKGEWSELYVLIHLLTEGELHQADMDLNHDEENVYKIIKAFKSEIKHNLEFDRGEKVTLYKNQNFEKEFVTQFEISQLKTISDKLYNGIKNGSGNSFPIIELDEFLTSASITKIKTDSSSKADINFKIYDHRLGKHCAITGNRGYEAKYVGLRYQKAYIYVKI